ncbi:SCO2400 family protein [[Kitasatospora] papulosa]
MDYCHPCQRHLNGALACAGCGTPADALVPFAVPADRPGRDAEPARAASQALDTTGRRRRARGETRRRGRRTHRRRGRALLLTAVGVVLALGALSLAELAMEPGGDSGASEYVSEATSSATEPLPSASSGTEPDGPAPGGRPHGGAGHRFPLRDGHRRTGRRRGGDRGRPADFRTPGGLGLHVGPGHAGSRGDRTAGRAVGPGHAVGGSHGARALGRTHPHAVAHRDLPVVDLLLTSGRGGGRSSG